MQMSAPQVFVFKCQAEQSPQSVCGYLFSKGVFLFQLTVEFIVELCGKGRALEVAQ